MKQNTTLTTVRLPDDLFEAFRIECVRNKFSITKLTERSMFMYVTNDAFRQLLHNQLDTTLPTIEK